MTIAEAFDEVLSKVENDSGLANLLNALGCSVPVDENGPDTAFIQPEIKVIVGMLLVDNQAADLSPEAKRALKDGLAKLCSGKAVEGISDSALDADIDNNLDLM